MMHPALQMVMSLVLCAGVTFCLTTALRGATVTRINYSGHALMGLGMLAMLWHQIELPLLPQLLLFASGSFWFLLQAAARPGTFGVSHGVLNRIKCAYHAGMFAAMMFMLVAMNPAAQVTASTVASTGHGGHGAHAPGHTTSMIHTISATTPSWVPGAAGLLAVLFGAAALLWLFPLPHRRPRMGPTHNTNRAWPFRPAERAHETAAAATMAFMFVSMAL